MGSGIRLTNRQGDVRDHLHNTTGAADVFRNCSILLLSDGGHASAAVAQLLGCSPETVKRIRRLYREGGLDALTPKRPPGRASQATPTFREVLSQALQTNPQTLGYGFATWSTARLAAHLAQITGLTLSAAQVRRLMHAEGFSVHRPKHTLQGKRAEAAYQKAKAPLRRLKKKPKAKDAPEALDFQDEVEMHRHPALARVWAKVGTQPEVPAPGKNERKAVYGGIDYATGRTTYTVADTKGGVKFLAFLLGVQSPQHQGFSQERQGFDGPGG
jgi:transposase